MLALYIEELSKTYKLGFQQKAIKALDSLYLSLPQGSTFGLLGPNGAGKTTTIKAVLNLIKIDQGRIRIFGEDHYNHRVREKIGFLPEQPYFNLNLNVLQTLKFYGQLFRLNPGAIKKRSYQLLEELGLEQVHSLPLYKYSKGMLQRLGLALSLLNNPSLLILDEPTSGLDPVGQFEVRKLFSKLKKEGKTILLCSHLLTEVEKLCDYVAIINKGKLALSGLTKELLREREKVRVSFVTPDKKLPSQLKKITVKTEKNGQFFTLETTFKESNSLIANLIKNRCQIVSVSSGGSLEEVFIEAVEDYGN